MSEPFFSVAVSHAAHLPGRPAALERLQENLGMAHHDPNFFVYKMKCGVQERSEAQWRFSFDTGAKFHIMMDDDVVPCPDFLEHAKRAVTAHPDQIVNFYPICIETKAAYDLGAAWIVNPDGILGRAYCMSHALLGEFLQWREEALSEKGRETVPEDTQICLFAFDTERMIYSTLPALVSCNLDVAPTWAQGGKFSESAAPFYDYKHNWDSNTFGGFVFCDYPWYLLTACRPDYIRKKDLVRKAYSIDKEIQAYLLTLRKKTP